MSVSTLRFLAVSGVAALTLAAPSAALAAAHGHHHVAKTHGSHKHHGKPAPARFTANGIVVSVDTTAGTVTLADKGGSRDLHGKTVTVTVSSTTKVTRDDAPATLDKLQSGDHVTANGMRAAGGVLNAKHVNAESTPQPEATESPSPEPTSTDSPAGTTTGP